MVKRPVGREVVSGVVDFYVTFGLPLPDIIQNLHEKNIVPCWVSFVREGKELGWTMKTLVSRVRESIVDVHGKDYWEKMETQFQDLVVRMFEEEKKI